ncbi:hypothetical protein ACH5RR_039016 [Cinchona calisaya]|uniref:Uncharacterized protein n=1 Tax=Cinchona calisaya TaxID=153742 RepID=A0ABD2Y2K6_9GENT
MGVGLVARGGGKGGHGKWEKEDVGVGGLGGGKWRELCLGMVERVAMIGRQKKKLGWWRFGRLKVGWQEWWLGMVVVVLEVEIEDDGMVDAKEKVYGFPFPQTKSHLDLYCAPQTKDQRIKTSHDELI